MNLEQESAHIYTLDHFYDSELSLDTVYSLSFLSSTPGHGRYYFSTHAFSFVIIRGNFTIRFMTIYTFGGVPPDV